MCRFTNIVNNWWLFFCCCLWMAVFPLKAQHDAFRDTTRSLPEIVIVEKYQVEEVRSSSPVQKMDARRLQATNSLLLSDAVKHLSGVTVKDYGGIGGLKTVSIRSLGANHTAVGYDGIALSDCQSGQIDISRFSLDNVDHLSLANGQSDDIFRPARMMAAAGILDIYTLTPRFSDGKFYNVRATLKGGSFGFVNPSLRWEQQFAPRWSVSLNAEWLSADGSYPYTLHYGGANDSVSHEKRRNTQVKSGRVEGELFANFSDKEQWRTKFYYYQSYRELPNATTFYNDRYDANLNDKQFFVQSQYRRELNDCWALRAALKYNRSYQRYYDPSSLTTDLGVNTNRYIQDEYYLTYSTLCRLLPGFSLALNLDASVNTLDATGLHEFAYPTRYAGLGALAAKYVNRYLTATASLLGTLIHEETKFGACAGDHKKLTPYVSLSLRPFDELFYIRAFYKHIFRLPSFNDLYYSRVGNLNLKPEYVTQYNLGLAWSHFFSDYLPHLSFSADAYYNRVTDKIVAVPTKNIFVWSMMNLGVVDIRGLDLAFNATVAPHNDWKLNLSANYTFQHAVDKTGKEGAHGKVYGHQIAYTPRVSGSGEAELVTPYLTLSYALLCSGSRYIYGQNIKENRLPGYADHSLSARKTWHVGKSEMTCAVELLNLLDKNYEIIKYYPMPGRSFRASLTLRL